MWQLHRKLAGRSSSCYLFYNLVMMGWTAIPQQYKENTNHFHLNYVGRDGCV